MRWSVAREWLRTWRECPPAAESLQRIAQGLGVWKPPGEPRASTEDELLAFAMLMGGKG